VIILLDLKLDLAVSNIIQKLLQYRVYRNLKQQQMRDLTDDPDTELPAKPSREYEDIEPDAPVDSHEEEGKVEEVFEQESAILQEPTTPSRLSSIADSTVIKLARSEPMIASLQDHFSLNTPSNLIRFRHRLNAARVYDSAIAQTVLEEEYNENTDTSTITVRQMKDLTSGTTILRISYSVVTALWTG
jgi:hypothetical protein